MNKSGNNTIILIIQLLDWILFIAIVGGGIYATLHADPDNRFLPAVATLSGLAIVNQISKWSVTKIAGLRQERK